MVGPVVRGAGVVRGLVLLVGMLTIVGCGRAKKPWEFVHPVQGVINYQGKPLAEANITLIPVDESIPETVRPTGRTDEDGVFTIGTYSQADGAPAGEYKVLVLRFPVIVTPTSASSGPNNLPKKYSRPETTDLVVTIEEGENSLAPLELN